MEGTMKMNNSYYNGRKDDAPKEAFVPKKRKGLDANGEPFGKRLARLRQAAGFSQYTLADELGISQRMVAYYEGETEHAPTHLLPALAKALGVSTDQLLGLEKENPRNRDFQLWRRFSKVAKLPPQKRKQIVQIVDTFLEMDKLKEAS
jgi:transcriptional regulator with XRE-family HTH domain